MLLLLDQPLEEFELNLLFSNKKNPRDAFNKISDAFNCLNIIDEYYLSLADDKLVVTYELENLEFSSIKTKIAQIIREIPDEAIGNFDWKKLVGHFLLKLKYRLLKFLENDPQVDNTIKIEKFIKDVESEKTSILGESGFLLSEASIFELLNLLEKFINSAKKMSDDEQLEYVTEFGVARIDNKVNLNKSAILLELGEKTSSSETTEILKIKSSDFLSSEKMWSFKLRNKSINAKIVDHEWLRKYYKRDFPLLPNDSLKVSLKVVYNDRESGEIYSPHYEITKVIEVIYPENDDVVTLF